MSDSDEPQVINSDSEESLSDAYDDSVDEDDDDVEDDDIDDDDDDDDDDDYDDKDLMKSVLNNTQKQNQQINNGNMPTTFPQRETKPKAKFKYERTRLQNQRSYQIYKKRSINCLNSKFKRDKYKKYLKDIFNKSKQQLVRTRAGNLRRSVSSEIVCLDDEKEEERMAQAQPQFIISTVAGGVQLEATTQPINGAADETEAKQKQEPMETGNSVSQRPKQNGLDEQLTQVETATVAAQNANAQAQNAQLTNGLHEDETLSQKSLPPATDTAPQSSKTTNTQQPAATSTPSPDTQPADLASNAPPNLYKEINQLFPKYDKVLTEHVESDSSSAEPLIKSIDENMLQLENDICTINELIRQKEVEWNRLLHLKRIKQEIIQRLQRKKQKLAITCQQNGQSGRTLSELKELEDYLSQTNSPYAIKTALNGNNSTLHSNASTVAQLINNRASMKREELAHENSIITRLQKFLEKNKILTKVTSGATNKTINKVLPAMSIQENTDYDREQADCSSKWSAKPAEYAKREVTSTAQMGTCKTLTYDELKLKYKVEQCAQRSAALANLKRKRMDASEEQTSRSAFGYPLLQRQSTALDFEASAATTAELMPPKPANLKRKHYEIEDDEDYLEAATPQAYTETVYQYYPQQHSLRKANSLDMPGGLRRLSANNLLLNAQTPKYAAQADFAKHSTPKLHSLASNLQQVDKETYSILETTNGDTTIVNGHAYEPRQPQLYNGRAALANEYYDEDIEPDYDFRYTSTAPRQQQKVILNGKQFKQQHDEDDDEPCATFSCHECNASEARIACSGCLNQWYCSRDCQINAWAQHSQTCRK